MSSIKAIFLDIGGVLLTNGWDHQLRSKTAETFNIDRKEMESRHLLIFDTYETGKLTLDEYLKRTIFYEKRSFTVEDIKHFILNSAQAFNEMIHLVKKIKGEYGLKVGVVSNEGRELAIDRINRFDLGAFVDFFVVSSFVHFRKPDADIYKLAIDLTQVPPSQIVYIDDRLLLTEIATGLGIQGIHHEGIESTKEALYSRLTHAQSYSEFNLK